MKTLAVLVTAAALTTLAGPAQAASAAPRKPARIVLATALPVTSARVVVGVGTTGVATGSRVTVIDDGRVIGRSRVTAGKAIVPISSKVQGSRVTVVVAGQRRIITVRTDAAALAASPWLVVNKKVSAGSSTPPRLTTSGNLRLQPSAAGAYEKMAKTAARQGTSLWVASSYRSAARQKSLYTAYVARDGRKAADTYSARPGHSEHQTGLAVDVAGSSCTLSGCFADTAAGRFVKSDAYRYGFVVRYPKGADATTGYRYEPWHLRYVGPWLAGYLHSVGSLTLERAFALPAAPDYAN